MNLSFYKFQANGNDFVLIDNREKNFPVSRERIALLCHRRFGIGADGLMLLGASEDVDFVMQYFNADGSPGEMCGNGGRCIAALAFLKGIAGKEIRFVAGDGIHEARIEGNDAVNRVFDVSLKMQNVTNVEAMDNGLFLNTGVPHFVRFVSDIEMVDVTKAGRKLRNDPLFSPEGTNVDFVEIQKDRLFVRTYERGVEEETLSCGTGVTASAIAAFLKTSREITKIRTRGGDFRVHFQVADSCYEEVWLRGPATLVFEGNILVS